MAQMEIDNQAEIQVRDKVDWQEKKVLPARADLADEVDRRLSRICLKNRHRAVARARWNQEVEVGGGVQAAANKSQVQETLAIELGNKMAKKWTIADRKKSTNLPLVKRLTRESRTVRKEDNLDVGEGMKVNSLGHWPTGIRLNF
jgi:hypothetical protein